MHGLYEPLLFEIRFRQRNLQREKTYRDGAQQLQLHIFISAVSLRVRREYSIEANIANMKRIFMRF